MGKKYELQDGLIVYENAGRVVIEDEYKLGSSNRLLVLNSEAAQKLLDFLVNGEVVSEVHKHELNAVEHLRALDAAKSAANFPTLDKALNSSWFALSTTRRK